MVGLFRLFASPPREANASRNTQDETKDALEFYEPETGSSMAVDGASAHQAKGTRRGSLDSCQQQSNHLHLPEDSVSPLRAVSMAPYTFQPTPGQEGRKSVSFSRKLSTRASSLMGRLTRNSSNKSSEGVSREGSLTLNETSGVPRGNSSLARREFKLLQTGSRLRDEDERAYDETSDDDGDTSSHIVTANTGGSQHGRKSEGLNQSLYVQTGLAAASGGSRSPMRGSNIPGSPAGLNQALLPSATPVSQGLNQLLAPAISPAMSTGTSPLRGSNIPGSPAGLNHAMLPSGASVSAGLNPSLAPAISPALSTGTSPLRGSNMPGSPAGLNQALPPSATSGGAGLNPTLAPAISPPLSTGTSPMRGSNMPGSPAGLNQAMLPSGASVSAGLNPTLAPAISPPLSTGTSPLRGSNMPGSPAGLNQALPPSATSGGAGLNPTLAPAISPPLSTGTSPMRGSNIPGSPAGLNQAMQANSTPISQGLNQVLAPAISPAVSTGTSPLRGSNMPGSPAGLNHVMLPSATSGGAGLNPTLAPAISPAVSTGTSPLRGSNMPGSPAGLNHVMLPSATSGGAGLNPSLAPAISPPLSTGTSPLRGSSIPSSPAGLNHVMLPSATPVSQGLNQVLAPAISPAVSTGTSPLRGSNMPGSPAGLNQALGPTMSPGVNTGATRHSSPASALLPTASAASPGQATGGSSPATPHPPGNKAMHDEVLKLQAQLEMLRKRLPASNSPANSPTAAPASSEPASQQASKDVPNARLQGQALNVVVVGQCDSEDADVCPDSLAPSSQGSPSARPPGSSLSGVLPSRLSNVTRGSSLLHGRVDSEQAALDRKSAKTDIPSLAVSSRPSIDASPLGTRSQNAEREITYVSRVGSENDMGSAASVDEEASSQPRKSSDSFTGRLKSMLTNKKSSTFQEDLNTAGLAPRQPSMARRLRGMLLPASLKTGSSSKSEGGGGDTSANSSVHGGDEHSKSRTSFGPASPATSRASVDMSRRISAKSFTGGVAERRRGQRTSIDGRSAGSPEQPAELDNFGAALPAPEPNLESGHINCPPPPGRYSLTGAPRRSQGNLKLESDTQAPGAPGPTAGGKSFIPSSAAHVSADNELDEMLRSMARMAPTPPVARPGADTKAPAVNSRPLDLDELSEISDEGLKSRTSIAPPLEANSQPAASNVQTTAARPTLSTVSKDVPLTSKRSVQFNTPVAASPVTASDRGKQPVMKAAAAEPAARLQQINERGGGRAQPPPVAVSLSQSDNNTDVAASVFARGQPRNPTATAASSASNNASRDATPPGAKHVPAADVRLPVFATLQRVNSGSSVASHKLELGSDSDEQEAAAPPTSVVRSQGGAGTEAARVNATVDLLMAKLQSLPSDLRARIAQDLQQGDLPVPHNTPVASRMSPVIQNGSPPMNNTAESVSAHARGSAPAIAPSPSQLSSSPSQSSGLFRPKKNLFDIKGDEVAAVSGSNSMSHVRSEGNLEGMLAASSSSSTNNQLPRWRGPAVEQLPGGRSVTAAAPDGDKLLETLAAKVSATASSEVPSAVQPAPTITGASTGSTPALQQQQQQQPLHGLPPASAQFASTSPSSSPGGPAPAAAQPFASSGTAGTWGTGSPATGPASFPHHPSWSSVGSHMSPGSYVASPMGYAPDPVGPLPYYPSGVHPAAFQPYVLSQPYVIPAMPGSPAVMPAPHMLYPPQPMHVPDAAIDAAMRMAYYPSSLTSYSSGGIPIRGQASGEQPQQPPAAASPPATVPPPPTQQHPSQMGSTTPPRFRMTPQPSQPGWASPVSQHSNTCLPMAPWMLMPVPMALPGSYPGMPSYPGSGLMLMEPTSRPSTPPRAMSPAGVPFTHVLVPQRSEPGHASLQQEAAARWQQQQQVQPDMYSSSATWNTLQPVRTGVVPGAYTNTWTQGVFTVPARFTDEYLGLGRAQPSASWSPAPHGRAPSPMNSGPLNKVAGQMAGRMMLSSHPVRFPVNED